MKASDVFREADFIFGKKGTFEEAFPQITDVTVEVTEEGKGFDGRDLTERRRVYSKSDPPGEYADCSNSFCYNGGVGIGSILRTMVYARETHHEDTHFCQGQEGSPKGRRRYGPCFNHFKVKITLLYMSETPSSE